MNRINILKNSLVKKERRLNKLLSKHFEDVKSANGQPLNDKRNGHATLNRWERQNEAIRSQNESIEKTKRAIEREEFKIKKVNSFEIPDYLKTYLDKGLITQWRKYPNRFFVVGGGGARIVLENDVIKCSNLQKSKESTEEWHIFTKTYNEIKRISEEFKDD